MGHAIILLQYSTFKYTYDSGKVWLEQDEMKKYLNREKEREYEKAHYEEFIWDFYRENKTKFYLYTIKE
jgi:hypothetical protein